MKNLLSIISLVVLVSCSDRGVKNQTTVGENIPHKDLLQTIKNEYLYFNYDLGRYEDYILNKNKIEISQNLKIADTFVIKSFEQTLVFYSYSIGSDIIRETQYYKKDKDNGKWYRTSLYLSSYNNEDPFKDGNGSRAKEILDKSSDWEEDNKETKIRVFGNGFY